jgi:lipopolysaccharide/colanic/teichoic acid biosynthesis glycosyltransferase
MDRTIACLLLVAVAPIFLVLALIVRLTSRGPAISRQTRVGIDGKTFTMVNFRTTMRDDPRLTRVGRLLRRFSLDELPQLLNVVTGSMSLVGPRSLLPSDVAQYNGDVRQRLLVKPGLTWPLRSEDAVGFHFFYLEAWSPTLDLYILLRAVSIGLHPQRSRRRG